MERTLSAALRVVLCGGLAFFCSFVDRLSWPPVIPMASSELGLTAAQAGGFMSAFFLGYLLTQLPGGILADRLGTRKVLVVSLFLMGVFTLGTAWVPGYWSGMSLRFVAGIGSGAVLAASVKGVYDYFGPTRRATAMGFFMASSPLGLLVANIMSPLIAASHGWRASFLAAGCLTLIVWVFSWLMLPQSGTTVRPANEFQRPKNNIRLLFANRDLILTAAAGFFAMWGTWGTLTWANTYMHQSLGLSLKQSGQIMALFGLGALIGQPLAGWLSDWFPQHRRQTGMAILACFAILLWFFGINQDRQQLIILAPLLGAGAFIFGPVLNTFISELVEPHQVGTAIGLCNGVWQLGSVISPITAGLFLDKTGSYQWAFGVLAAGPMLAVLIFALVRTSGTEVN
ncbi:MAG: major facilitator superfamily 1 [Firmicutes bacterium]|nr:major facilitator superfamily 1 [Bacillota bacterium]